ncbi:glycosyltransferase family 2 protein [Clostridium sp. JS66]|uniref:glycosyltransferase family 2 protein n=1 Tax=Clostridium sp. JS66 TaxID=3064705 RepID=UPI00298E052D|nr:glycosyltransferase family 2 protein [Clostridium sp. JS66]WPC41071.1 glycosyltransferase family 2 protein [Clostridium sp. JS66]
MENLSIIVKEDLKENVYRYIEILKPLLEDGNTQLVIINNEYEKLEIDYDYMIYEFKENYKKFYEFCDSVCFNKNIAIIESGLDLKEDLIIKIKNLLVKNSDLNIKVCLKKYYEEEKYYIQDFTIIYNMETSKEERLNIEIKDFGLINSVENYLENSIGKFIENRKFGELYSWYKKYIINDENITISFYNYLEQNKVSMSSEDKYELEEYFINENLDKGYCSYINLKNLIENNKKISAENLNFIIKEAKFNEEDIYFAYAILDLFNKNIFIEEIFEIINLNVIAIYMKKLFEEDKSFYLRVYEFLVSIESDKKILEANNKNILTYMNIIEIYNENISGDSIDKDKKEKLVQLFIDYSKYGAYLLNENVDIPADKRRFLTKIKNATDFINLNKIKEAIAILKESAEIYNIMTMSTRYYVQKIIYENQLYSNKLSITMIVKNEEKNLDRCLKSIKPLLDNNMAELIIVDTGSEDNTVKIAQNYTDKIYFHQWKGSFSESRNWSISLANGEYVFIMDADYEIDKNSLKKIIQYFNSKSYKQYSTFIVKIKDYSDNECEKFSILPQYLIFKNEYNFYYFGKVHNQPNFKIPVSELDVMIYHYGYIMNTKEASDKKFNRTANLLKRELQKYPQNVYYRFQLTNSYSMYGDHKEALNQSKLYMKILDKEPLNYDYIMYYIAAAITHFSSKLYDNVIKICDDILSLNNDFIDAVFFKAQSLFLKKDYEDSIIFYKKYLRLLYDIDKNPIINDTKLQIYSIDSENVAEADLVVSYLKLNMYSETLNYILTKNKEKVVLYQHAVIEAYMKQKNFKELALFYKKYISTNLEKEMYNFLYYLKEHVKNISDIEKKEIIKEFNKLKMPKEHLSLIEFEMEGKEENSLKDTIRFVGNNNIEKMNIMLAQRVSQEIILGIFNNNVNLDNEEINNVRKCIKYILDQTLNKKTISGLNEEQILNLTFKYVDYSLVLYEKDRVRLNKKEIIFIENILISFQYMQNKDLVAAVRAIKSSVEVEPKLAKAMKLYIDSIIP